jgi:hypothetical protein
MKIHLTFNHEERDSLKAIDCQYTGEQVNKRVFKVISRITGNENIEKSSQISEIMHNELSYEEILFLATHSLQDKIVRIHKAKMIDDFKEMLDELNED